MANTLYDEVREIIDKEDLPAEPIMLPVAYKTIQKAKLFHSDRVANQGHVYHLLSCFMSR
jgi:hypothetical protein